MAKNKDESNSIGGSMKPLTERLVQAAAILVFLYIGWNLSVNTVVTLVKRNMQVQVLTQKLNQCQVALKDVIVPSADTSKK